MSERDDFAEELRGGDGEPMNAKGSLGQAVVTAVIVGLVMVLLGKLTDHHDETTTATAIATLTVQMANLTEQVKRLNEQPYVRREELNAVSNRVDGLDQRIGGVERAELERGKR